MSVVNKFLGLAIRGDYLSYSLVLNDTLFNLGSIDTKSRHLDYFSKFNSVLSLMKSEVSKEESPGEDSTPQGTWIVGVYHDPVPNRHNFDNERFYRLCRMKTIVECSCSLTLGCLPLSISDSEMCKAIGTLKFNQLSSAKVSDSKISNIDDVVKFATGKLSNFLNSPSSLQFNGLATSWAAALALKRRINVESLVLDEKDTLKIQSRLMNDRIVNELISSINVKKEGKQELKRVLRRRVHKLVEDYVEGLV